MFEKSPDYSNLKVFGSLCYATIITPHKDKFASRSHKCVVLDYPFATKGYRVLDLESRKVFISRDVFFVEDCFSFQSLTSNSSPLLFYDQPVTIDDDPLFFSIPLQSQSATNSEFVISSSPAHSNNRSPTSLMPTVATRPTRTKVLPTKYKDFTGLPYHLTNSISHPLTLSYESFDKSYSHFLANISVSPEPTTFYQASKHIDWCKAMATELAALDANHTWDIVPLPPGKGVVSCRWLYKTTFNPDGTVERLKARLVARGFSQTVGVDFF